MWHKSRKCCFKSSYFMTFLFFLIQLKLHVFFSRPLSGSKPACRVSNICLAKEPCKNRGKCSVTKGGAVCSCTPAWRGEYCQLPAQPCGGQSDPCGDDFRCTREADTLAGFSCNCHRRPGWTAKSGKVADR